MQALVETPVDGRGGVHAPDGEARGGLVVRHLDIRDVALREIVLGRRDAREVGIVDRQEVDVLGDTGVEQVCAEVAGPKAARELHLEVRVNGASGLCTGLADAKVGRDGILALVARHDFVKPLPAPELALKALRDLRHGLRPCVRVKRRRLEAKIVHSLRQSPRGGALQADPRSETCIGVRADRAVEAVEAPDVRERLKPAPSGEVANVAETEVGREARDLGRGDVRRAEWRGNADAALELRIGREGTGILGVVAGLNRDGERAALVEAGEIKRGRAARGGLHVESLLGDNIAENVAHRCSCARRACRDIVAPVDRERRRLAVLVHSELGIGLDVEMLAVRLEVHRAAAPVPWPWRAVRRDELQEEEAARAACAAVGPGELDLAVAGVDRLRRRPEPRDANVSALLGHDAVRVVNPRTERRDADLRLPLPPGLGRIEMVAHLHRDNVAGILRDRRIAIDPERALLERDALRIRKSRPRGRCGCRRAALAVRRSAPRNADVDVLHLLLEVALGREKHDGVDRRHPRLCLGLEVERHGLAGLRRTARMPREESAVFFRIHGMEIRRKLDAFGNSSLQRHLHRERTADGLGAVNCCPVEFMHLAERAGREHCRNN